ncbi:ATP-binding protein [Streptomyces sp. NPDC051322]|uniref:ATP-binding protein n=1 Tax=Streptomyces sp. NPDC051322 TaxID=3154645 RepID=UPI00344FCBB4
MTTVTPPWAYALQLPHDPHAPGIARKTLRAVLHSHGLTRLTDTAELLASELVTNAYQHSRGPYGLRVRPIGPDRLRLAVWDSDPAIPVPFGPPPTSEDAEYGRGLQLVRLCAASWGAYVLGSGGKVLWAECEEKGDCQWGDLL